jgi:hypothetical protein
LIIWNYAGKRKANYDIDPARNAAESGAPGNEKCAVENECEHETG